MDNIKMTAELRENIGVKGALSKIRDERKIPAVLYGTGKESISITIDEKAFTEALKMGSNSIIELALPKGAEKVIIKDIQYDVVTDKIIHVDFIRVSMKETIEVEVPVVLEGESPDIKTHGAIVDHISRVVNVKCIPTNIPHEIVVDMTKITIDESYTIGKLDLGKDVEILDDADKIIVHLIIPRQAAEEEEKPAEDAEATEDGAEPEISVEKGKKEEEGKEGAKDGGSEKKAEDKKTEGKK
ncbi:MAG: 50S ribosomal protein L25 [Elusimicrobiaceae bacterium]|jgi:large subunit ribosomal protein L25|nr:50S ribosomal protein L25 [Elusimicrobiaceae bacterium]MBT3954752.1 50S ribosomal protein L25 [Elusimicrobiaceae bacterium]MBT4008057.1 50S ribosomal protein L25 [Elusimicrobiaceae bacterium]MBT4402616.1 50S ribosomal protein L25 [Elusimicrobiaceae bacterium]MBT4439490.1 50S ribosomal protein L25 [Elusimicrobiaceae bacterium]